MKARLVMPNQFHHGNILWTGDHKPRNGRWPKSHPVAPDESVYGFPVSDQFGKSNSIEEFRARGYWASCFPEGDGITFKLGNTQDAATVAKDVAECFGFEVTA